MGDKYSIADVLANPAHEMYPPVKDYVEKIKSGEITLCGCLGAMYGEPYCPCEMRRNGLQEFMDNNPLRKAADENSKEQWKEFWEKGGFGQFKVEK